MNFDPLMWFALSEMDADDEEREQKNDSYDNYWSNNNEVSEHEETIAA